MDEIKRCLDCGQIIANMYECDYYRYIRLKRCPECAQVAKKYQNAKSQKRYMKRKRIDRLKREFDTDNTLTSISLEYTYKQQQLDLLKKENALLREKIKELRQ